MDILLATIHKHHRKKQGQPGYTLVEILMVMLISFIVLGGVYKAITTESIDLDKEEIILDMQLKARAAIDIIANDIRKAGFLGCSGAMAADTTGNSGAADLLQSSTTTGIIGTNLPVMDALKANAGGVDYLGDPLAYVNNVTAGHVTYQEGTDVLTVRYLSGDEPVQSAMADGTVPIVLGTNDFNQGDILYITDCEFYSLFQKTNGDSTLSINHALSGTLVPDNSTTNLGQAYGLNARVYEVTVNTYFIQNGSFAISQNDTGTDIVDNIEDLQFQYKFDENNNNDLSDENWRDDPFALGATASDIREIKIYVLARSDQVFSYTNTDLYDYPNSPYTTTPPGDHRYRYLASAVVTLRNSGL